VWDTGPCACKAEAHAWVQVRRSGFTPAGSAAEGGGNPLREEANLPTDVRSHDPLPRSTGKKVVVPSEVARKWYGSEGATSAEFRETWFAKVRDEYGVVQNKDVPEHELIVRPANKYDGRHIESQIDALLTQENANELLLQRSKRRQAVEAKKAETKKRELAEKAENAAKTETKDVKQNAANELAKNDRKLAETKRELAEKVQEAASARERLDKEKKRWRLVQERLKQEVEAGRKKAADVDLDRGTLRSELDKVRDQLKTQCELTLLAQKMTREVASWTDEQKKNPVQVTALEKELGNTLL